MKVRLSVLVVSCLCTRVLSLFGVEDYSLKSMLGIGVSKGLGVDITGIFDGISELEKRITTSQNDIVNTVTAAQKAFSSKFNMIMDIVDDHALMGYFAELIPEAREKGFGNNTCIEGVTTKKNHVGTLTLRDGKLHYVEPMDMIAEPLQDYDDFTLFNSSFTFKDINVTCAWDFVGNPLVGIGYNFLKRTGSMELVQKGPNRVTLTATVPKSRTVLDDKVRRGECFMKVEHMEVMLGEQVVVNDVSYNSATKYWLQTSQGGTEYFVRQMIVDMEGQLMTQLKKTLKSVVSPATTRTDVFCKNSFVTPEPIDCTRIKNIGEYWSK